jgi:hypothetical protein
VILTIEYEEDTWKGRRKFRILKSRKVVCGVGKILTKLRNLKYIWTVISRKTRDIDPCIQRKVFQKETKVDVTIFSKPKVTKR